MDRVMDTEHFKKKLLEKERDLQATLSSFEDEARAAGDPEVRDEIDDATVAKDTSTTLESASMMSETLREVQDALQRIEDGSYGTCAACGREIEKARLEAIPWALYCLEDQEKQDALGPAYRDSTL